VALKAIQRKYMVATSKTEEMNEFYGVTPHLLHQFDIDLRKSSFIMNFEGQGSETKMNIATYLNSANVASVPYIALAAQNSKHYKTGLSKLVDLLIADYNLPLQEQKAEKSGFLKSLRLGTG
jgi:hypothetical protein